VIQPDRAAAPFFVYWRILFALQSLLIRIALLVALTPLGARAQTPVLEAPVMPWQVIEHIVTGSVVDVRGIGLVRLAGVDDFGEPSRAFLSGMLSGQAVRVMATTYSEAGLTHALLYVPDGRCVNVEMLRSGYARVRAEPGFDRLEEFRGLQADAERLKRGMWGMAAGTASVARTGSAPADSTRAFHRFHVAAGGGATVNAGDREWMAELQTDIFIVRASSVYLSAAYTVGDPASARPWQASAGLRLVSPARAFIRPYLRAGGGYMRIETGGDSAGPRERPFWEGGGGLLIAGGPIQFDAGYVFTRVDRTDIARVFGLLGLRF